MTDDWTTPGTFEVADGVFRVPLPLPNDGLRAVNVYVIATGDGYVLIDSGWSIPEAGERIGQALHRLGGAVEDIRRFLITHVHRDHYTHAIVHRRAHGTPVALGANERPSLETVTDPKVPVLDAQMILLDRHGAAELANLLRGAIGELDPNRQDFEAPDDWLEPGPVGISADRTLDAIETPGHTRGHLVFHDAAAELLFAGDHVLPTITPSIGFEPVLSVNPLGDFLGSLAKVRGLPDAALLPAHGDVGMSVHARIDQLIDHHGTRLRQTEAAVLAGAATGWDVAGRLRWTRRGKRLDEMDEFNQMLAVSETAAHLDLLVAQGRLQRVEEAGVWHYQAA